MSRKKRLNMPENTPSFAFDRRGFDKQRIWIIGASSGIGAAVAQRLAGLGANLVLSARRASLLEELRTTLENDGHVCCPLDVSDDAALRAAINDVCALPLHRLLFFPALYTQMPLDGLHMETIRDMFAVNLLSAFTLVDALAPVIKRQQLGQLALCGSLAGYGGLPYSQPYGATKAGIISLAETLALEFPSLDVKAINPGFVTTDLTASNDWPMPFCLSTEQAALYIERGLQKRGFDIHFPKIFSWSVKLVHALPYAVKFRLLRAVTSKVTANTPRKR